ncbi:hypothetical protein TNIN_433491 [Trichonephila inaurata madagascariensis]|uniref:Uncharacterized protein n=1 Tax=Trichonephila inaurata madagascariensis TaxID=2747483 RepID=A0A8X7C396_9ARAC|nr:hypothetical protein TNIN_433491 [Trichonephila inaurata madagascariensis]
MSSTFLPRSIPHFCLCTFVKKGGRELEAGHPPMVHFDLIFDLIHRPHVLQRCVLFSDISRRAVNCGEAQPRGTLPFLLLLFWTTSGTHVVEEHKGLCTATNENTEISLKGSLETMLTSFCGTKWCEVFIIELQSWNY